MNARVIVWRRGLAAAGFVGLLACSREPAGRGAGEPGPETVAAPLAGGAAKVAPEFALEDLEGRTVKLSDSAGKIRLLDFWATWCAPCREEIPMLNDLQATYGARGFEILAIAEEDQAVLREFARKHDMRYRNLVGTDDVAESYGVLGLPTAYLLDPQGRIVESFLGPKPRRVLTEKIQALLEEIPGS